MTPYVFVYGTLRNDPHHEMYRFLARNATFAGGATVPGILFDFGKFPGAIPSVNSQSRVNGELYKLARREVLTVLDAYEGCGLNDPKPREFHRRMAEVRLDDGRAVQAWVYWYTGNTEGADAIPSGDYLNLS